jgi:hypothetical protein
MPWLFAQRLGIIVPDDAISEDFLCSNASAWNLLKIIPFEIEKAGELNLVNKGIVAEQIIGQHLHIPSVPYQPPQLFYWARENRAASAEVDYIIEPGDGSIAPVEVKSGHPAV